jgi:hypothetical protein
MHNVRTEKQKADDMQNAVDAVARLSWDQLLILQRNLSEHILNCYDMAEMRRAEALAADEKANPRPN